MEFTPPNTQPGDPHLVAPSPSLPSDLHHLTAPPHFSFANYGAPPTLPAGPRIGTSTAATTSSLAALVSPTPPNSPVLTPNPFSFGNYWQRAMSAPPSSFNFLQGPVGPSQAWPGWHRHHPGSKCPASPSASSPAHLITKTIEEVQEPRVPLCFYVPLNCLASFTVKVMSTKPAGTRATRNSQRGVVPDTEEAEEAETPAPARRGSKKTPVAAVEAKEDDEEPAPAPASTRRGPKNLKVPSPIEYEDDDEEPVPAAAAARRGSKRAPVEDEDESDEAPPPKKLVKAVKAVKPSKASKTVPPAPVSDDDGISTASSDPQAPHPLDVHLSKPKKPKPVDKTASKPASKPKAASPVIDVDVTVTKPSKKGKSNAAPKVKTPTAAIDADMNDAATDLNKQGKPKPKAKAKDVSRATSAANSAVASDAEAVPRRTTKRKATLTATAQAVESHEKDREIEKLKELVAEKDGTIRTFKKIKIELDRKIKEESTTAKIPRPATIGNLRTAINLDADEDEKEEYNLIQGYIREIVIKGMDASKTFRKQVDVDAMCRLAAKRFPRLAAFQDHWATKEFMKTSLGNRRKKHIKAEKLAVNRAARLAAGEDVGPEVPPSDTDTDAATEDEEGAADDEESAPIASGSKAKRSKQAAVAMDLSDD